MQIIQEIGTFDRLCEACNREIDLPDLQSAFSNVSIYVNDEDVEGIVEQSEPYYGKALSNIRKADKITLDKLQIPIGDGKRSRRNLLKELQLLHEDTTLPYLSVVPIDGAVDNCLACMEGSPDSPWAGGIFWLHMTFPPDYPFKPPSVRFITPVYHPNIDRTGRVCIDILESAWGPGLTTGTILLSILSVLHEPFVDDPLVPEIASKYIESYDEYYKKVRHYTTICATAKRPETSNLINLIF